MEQIKSTRSRMQLIGNKKKSKDMQTVKLDFVGTLRFLSILLAIKTDLQNL